MRPARHTLSLCVLGALTAFSLSACARGYDRVKDGPLEIKDAWVRVTNVTASAAMYGTFQNHDDATVNILSVSTAAARSAELHETMEMSGMSHMQHLDSLPVAPKGTLTFKPGGIHVMLTDLGRPMATGDTVVLTFQLGGGGSTIVKAVVREP